MVQKRGKMLEFCSHSLFRKYGWQFIRHVAMPHPVKTAGAVIRSGALDFSGGMTAISNEAFERSLEGAGSIVGVGFCLKPMNPPCPSGRSNHDCHYLENLRHSKAADVPACCRRCAIREMGIMTLKTGAAFYIMTSAEDILFDVFKPAIEEGRFSSGLFILCRYSMRPFAVGMLASGVSGWLFTFEQGDCQDYKTWFQADRGIKEEQTIINEQNQRTIREVLENAVKAISPNAQFERRGNVFHPRIAADKKDLAPGRSTPDCV